MRHSYSRRTVTALLGATPLLLLRGGAASGQVSEMPPKPRSEAEQIALDAYVYGYSLITTEVTRVQMSNVDKIEGMHAPTGQFANIKRYPAADFRGVSAPNADTLYSVAWLDLAEPQVFSHPDMGKRFYLFEMTDLWMTDFNSPGTRTAGGNAANYLITGPGWAGNVPDRDEADQVRHALYGDPGAHLRRRHRPGLRGRQCVAGSVQDRATQRIRQTLHLPDAPG